MFYTIENECIRATFSSLGGEITSIYGKKTACEYLWQGDAASWAKQAPVLFPICGRLYEGIYTYRGKEYTMGCHGFFREMEMTVEEKTDTAITFRVSDNEESRKMYPFSFVFRLTYSLSGDTLHIMHAVENTGDDPLIFALGAHPGFRVPLGNDSCDDYEIVFDSSVTEGKQILFEKNFTSGKYASSPLPDGKFRYSNEIFDVGSLFFSEIGDHVTLSSPVSGRFVRLDFAGFPVLGFWHAEGTSAPFLCIEPWESVPSFYGKIDDLETKAMMHHLEKNGYYKKGYSITVG